MAARIWANCWPPIVAGTFLAATGSSAQERPSAPASPAEADASPTASTTSSSAKPAIPVEGNTIAFPAKAEAITVDVVVLGKDGNPVKDLDRSEFTLLEDGRPQAIVGFEPRDLSPAGETPAPIAGAIGAASNERGAGPVGRTLAFLIDDLGIEPLHMTEVAKALSRWLDHGADPRDEVTLATTSGDAWWSDAVRDGRADLEAVLGRIKGKKTLAAVRDAMSDYEAYSIDTLGSPITPPADAPPPNGPPTGTSTCTTNAPTANVLDRVVDRWFRTVACVCDPMSVQASIASCRGLAMARAHEVYSAATQRGVGALNAVARISRGLAGARGRKSIILLSEGLLRDTRQSVLDDAVDASRRGNTAVSFVDVRGLIGVSTYSAEQTAPPKGGDLGVMSVENTLLETAGGEYIAETTGGSTVRNTNDIEGSVKRLADESSAYYLLGYQIDRTVDGRWHKLEVKVSRPGVKVRMRRGYFATAAEPPGAETASLKAKKSAHEKGKGNELPVRALDPALAVGGERDDIPLRIAPYVFETDGSKTARVLVAMEVGTTALTFAGTGGQRTASVDLTILGVSRDLPKTFPLDSHAELSVDAKAVGGWWTFSRELRLPPGTAQIRAFVRDSASGRSGLVVQRIEIPGSDAPYISTPILSDRLLPPQGAASSPKIVPAAHRRFQNRGFLYCAYEVYVAPGRELKNIPRIAGGYTIEDAGGNVVASAPPTPIAIALDAHIVRLLSIPLGPLSLGQYWLTIQTEDRASGLNLETKVAFSVEAHNETEARPN